jgi:hypothetical protein
MYSIQRRIVALIFQQSSTWLMVWMESLVWWLEWLGVLLRSDGWGGWNLCFGSLLLDGMVVASCGHCYCTPSAVRRVSSIHAYLAALCEGRNLYGTHLRHTSSVIFFIFFLFEVILVTHCCFQNKNLCHN